MTANQSITPFLWFDDKAEEAMKFYVSVFSGSPKKRGDSRIISIARYEKGMESPGIDDMVGKVLTGVFELDGQQFMALDGGPIFKFNEAFSLLIECEDQKEIDYFWEKLSAVPESEVCGWLKDKYGVSWQITPKNFTAAMNDPDRKKAIKIMNAVLKMKKIIIKELESV
jgi:predicted 3-demethylubiquinone-9 3-methyltransferase (glyoxalase superfamily)